MKLCLALLIALTTLTDAQSERFAIAVVRPDGAIVPFAAYDAGRWEKAWPAADEATESPQTIDGIHSVWRRRRQRVPRTWAIWLPTGARAIQAHVSGIEIVNAHCERQVALKTNLPAIRGEQSAKDGVAVDSNVPVVAVEKMNESSSGWKAAAEIVLANFAPLEAAQARTVHQDLPHELPHGGARITALYRESTSSRSAMYFVAEKKYRTPASPQDPSCARMTVMTGWLLPTADGALTVRDAKVFLTECDEKEVRTAVPLAAVDVSNRVFWVLEERGYEDETYLIAEPGPSDVRYPIEVNGGGC